MAATSVAIAAIVLSALTFIASQHDARRRGQVAYLADLERRFAEQAKQLSELQARVDTCENDRQKLHDDNFRLMQRVLKLENGH